MKLQTPESAEWAGSLCHLLGQAACPTLSSTHLLWGVLGVSPLSRQSVHPHGWFWVNSVLFQRFASDCKSWDHGPCKGREHVESGVREIGGCTDRITGRCPAGPGSPVLLPCFWKNSRRPCCLQRLRSGSQWTPSVMCQRGPLHRANCAGIALLVSESGFLSIL